MKYLKTFENLEYKIDDFVLLDPSKFKSRKRGVFELPMGQISSINSYSDPNIKNKFYNVNSYDDGVFILDYEDILRHLTPEEIEEFEAKKLAYKYNL